jgi:VWFA-related protein
MLLAMVLRLACALPVLLAVLSADQQRPGFRGGIDLVTLDVSAIGQDGRPLRDLRLDELTLTVDGKPRVITSFEYNEVAHPTSAGGNPAFSAPPPAGSNLPAEAGRNVFIVVLHDHIRPGNERQAMQGVGHLVDQLTPRDRIAVVTMPFGRVEVDLTSDFKRVKARLPQIIGHSTEAVPKGEQTTSEGRALVDFLKNLVKLQGPKTIVLISEGFNTGSGRVPTADNELDTGTAILTRLGSQVTEIADLRSAAAAARANFYVIQPNNMPTDAAIKDRADEGINRGFSDQMEVQTSALASVASVTGGQYFRLSGTATNVFDRILRETSGYYALAFESDPEDRTVNKERSIVIRTTRPGVKLQARRTFLNQGIRQGTKSASARAMLNDPLAYGDVLLRATAYTTRGTGGKLKVVAVAEALEPTSLKEVAFALVDAKRSIAAAWPADIKAAGAPIVAAELVTPGHYRLRAAAVDTDGRGGSVDYEFDAALQPVGALSAGSMMLGTASDEGTFQPRLVFAEGQEITSYFELYGTAADVTVAGEIRTVDGTLMATSPGTLAPTRDADRRVVTSAFVLRKLSPAITSFAA